MIQLDPNNRPGLLVSVRDASEALAALAGGAHVIDVKEPNRGSLGAADATTIAAVVRAVNGRAPVTAAAGELIDLPDSNTAPMPDGVSLFKIGLAGCLAIKDWPLRWREAISTLWPNEDAPNHSVAVAYADWQTADAPPPREVLRAAAEIGSPALLIDTWNKSNGCLFDYMSPDELQELIQIAQSHKLLIVLAGSLTGDSVVAAARLRPDLVAVRTAACHAGRGGTVKHDRVIALRQAIAPANVTQAASNH